MQIKHKTLQPKSVSRQKSCFLLHLHQKLVLMLQIKHSYSTGLPSAATEKSYFIF